MADENESTRTIAVSAAAHERLKRHLAKYQRLLGRRSSLGQYATEAILRLMEHDMEQLMAMARLEGLSDVDSLEAAWSDEASKKRSKSK